MNQPARPFVLTARGLTVTVLYDEIECIVARLETQIEHTLWSFLGCGRERRVPVVRLNAWTAHGGPFSSTIEVENEEEGSRVLDDLLAQIPGELNGDEEEEAPAVADADEVVIDERPAPADGGEESENEESESDEERPEGPNPTKN